MSIAWSSGSGSHDEPPGRRYSTCVSRCDPVTSWNVADPFGHKRPREIGDEGSPSMLVMRPSRTDTNCPHPTAQYGQTDGTTESASEIRLRSASVCSDRAVDPKPDQSRARSWRTTGQSARGTLFYYHRLRRRAQQLLDLVVEVLLTFDVDVGQDPVEPLRQPPVGVAEQLHRRRHEQHAYHGGIDEDRHGQPETELLDHALVAEHERAEHGHHDQRGGGDDPRRCRQSVRHREAVVAGAVVLLLDAREEEHFVVHR